MTDKLEILEYCKKVGKKVYKITQPLNSFTRIMSEIDVRHVYSRL